MKDLEGFYYYKLIKTSMISSFSISRVLGIIFVCILIASGVTLFSFATYIHHKSVYSIAKEDAHTRAELIFESIFAVMKNGWTREEIDQIIDRFDQKLTDMEVRLIRSQKVADEHGDFAEAKEARENDEDIRLVFADKQERILEQGENLRFIYPVVVQQECLMCHTNVSVGDLNGVIEIVFPVSEIGVPLEYALNMIILFFAILLILLVAITIVSVRYFMVNPMVELSEFMKLLRETKTMPSSFKRSSIKEIETLRNSFTDLLDHLNIANQELRELTIKDPLTGLANRRHCDEMLNAELERAKRYEHPLSLLMIDLDKFKPINDQYGHNAGDAVLKAVANMLRESLRATDHIARVGGDEFEVILPETDAQKAEQLAEKIRTSILETEILFEGHSLSIGCSVGTSTYDIDGDEPGSLRRCADERMYHDKKRRNAQR